MKAKSSDLTGHLEPLMVDFRKEGEQYVIS